MTKKTIIKIIALTIFAAIPAASALVPHVANAGWLADYSADWLYTITAGLSQLIFTAAGWFISLCGVLLNGVMIATLNMKTIVDNTPAVAIAWRTIRDFSSIFIIFMLLFASIKMILGAKDHDLGSLIKNIIIAGLLINFSLFGTKLLIDASNIISCSFYTAMAPQSGACSANNAAISDAFSSTGLSNIFMQSLDIQAVAPDATTLKEKVNVHLSITLANLGSSVLMIIAGISFLVAALMFAIRIGVLILLMAFSPIYFIAMIMPQVAPYAKKWSGALYSMCIFMPVYLFLMYIAISIINDPGFFAFAHLKTGQTTGILSAHTVGIYLQYMIAFLMINAPLVAAISVANEGADFVGKMGDSVKKWGQGFVGQHTVGRAARSIGSSDTMGRFIKEHPTLGTFASGTLGKVSGGSFGGSKGGFDKRIDNHAKAIIDASKKVAASKGSYAAYTKETDNLKNQAEQKDQALALLNTAIESTEGEEYQNETSRLESQLDIKEQKLALVNTAIEQNKNNPNFSQADAIALNNTKQRLEGEKAGISRQIKDRKQSPGALRRRKDWIVEQKKEIDKQVNERKVSKSDIEGAIKKAAQTEFAKNLGSAAAEKDAFKKIMKELGKNKTQQVLEEAVKELGGNKPE